MILIIMRHGEAEDYREPDHTRALTAFGHKQCENVGKWLKENLSSLSRQTDCPVSDIDLALVSPYLRTQQSFRAVAKHIKVHDQITIDTITPLGNALQSADLIDAYASDSNAPKCIMIVTHMPLVSLLADRVCAGFNALFFETADALLVDYNSHDAIGKKLGMFQGAY